MNKVVGPGARIGRFMVEGVLGEGALAVVYRVRHTELKTLHALKVLKVPHAVVVERLMNEGRAQAQLRHPNIVSVTDIIDVNGSPGLLMEYVDGATLKDVLAQVKLTLPQAAGIGRGLIAGVAVAHRAGLIHRDLKPANVLMAIQGKKMIPKITDFGLVKALDGDTVGALETRTGIVLGTPQYMAPEQFDDARNVDRRADVFSLGVMLYEIVAGQRPYTGRGLLEIVDHARAGSFIPIEEREPDIPEGMRVAIEAALQADPGDRVGSAEILYRMWTESETEADLEAVFRTDIVRRIQQEAQASLERSLERLVPLPVPPLGTLGESDASTEEVRDDGAGTVPDPDEREPTEETDEGAKPPAVAPAAGAPEPTDESEPTEESPPWASPVMMAAAGLVVVGLLFIGGMGALGVGTLAVVSKPRPHDMEIEPAILLDPEPSGTPEPEPVEPEPGEPTPPVPTPDPAVPVPSPATQPEVSPAAEPQVPASPAPQPSATGPATVTVTGDHTAFSLRTEDGRDLPAGQVDPGMYTIYAAFPDDPMRERGKLKVGSGEQITLHCDGVVRFSCER